MRVLQHPLVLRFLFLLAVCQAVAPSVAAVADAWRMDRREVVAHMEAETGAGCSYVHHDHCALCAFVSGASDRVAPAPGWEGDSCAPGAPPVIGDLAISAGRLSPGQRAPPVS
jgi:hypothetical protein